MKGTTTSSVVGSEHEAHLVDATRLPIRFDSRQWRQLAALVPLLGSLWSLPTAASRFVISASDATRVCHRVGAW